MIRSRKGFMLILCLILLMLLLTLGLALSGKKMSQYRAAVQMGPAAQAMAIAESGLHDAILKMSKDPDFPPAGDQAQKHYVYTENFFDLDGATVVGTYTVEVDTSLLNSETGPLPYGIVRLTSTGSAGPAGSPSAQRRLYAEVDVSPTLRDGSGNPNPNLFYLVNWQDLGSP